MTAEAPPQIARAKREAVSCAHCGLPVAAGLVENGAELQFCCAGCRTVYGVIHVCGMERYYALLRGQGASGEPAKVTGKAYGEFDDAGFLSLHAPLRDSLRTIEFYLEGVHCTACVWLVEKLPAVVKGVMESRLNLGKALLRVTWADGTVRLSAIARALDSLGYPPHPARSNTARAVRTRDDRRQLIRIGVAGACAGNTMLLATALYAGLFAAMDPRYVLLFRWLSMAIGGVALWWPGSVFFRGAWAALRTRTPHLDLPIALGLGAGGIAGVIHTVTNMGEIYFDSLSVLVFLLLVGRFLQHRQQGAAEDAVELLFSLTSTAAHRVRTDDGVEDVPLAALQVADVVEVRAGESMPVDGELLAGYSTAVDESLLTGESRAKRIEAGGPVHAGTTNLTSAVRVKVTATGEATRVGRLLRLVTECARRKAPLVLFADRLGGRFLVAVLAIAAAVYAGWWWLGTGGALDHAVAVLIVACPCALGLATPLAMTVAIGRAARRGILIKGGDTLERLVVRGGTLFLDKTGTITVGRTVMQFWRGDESLQPAVAAIERQATHPIARAFCEALSDVPGVEAFAVVQGPRGIQGVVEGRQIVISSVAMAEESCGALVANWRAAIDECLQRGLTPVVVAVDGAARAVAGFGDAVRPDARHAIARLQRRGWRVAILSGDHPQIVARVAYEVGIAEAIGGLSPEDKLDHVRKAMRNGPVVMVGDGVNDAAALAAASVGIAVHGGAEASLAAASIYLNRPGLTAILEVMQAARNTLRVMRRSLAASLLYNTFAVTLAALGWINPLVAAILMPVSSLTVLSLALGVRTFERNAKGGVP